MKKIKKYILVILTCLILISAFQPIKPVFAATATPTNGKIYNLYNKASGKCLNVNLGSDANGTNVIQWTKDGSLEQRFKVESYSGGYRLRAICSSNGNGRVIDVYKVNGAINSGYNVDIWSVPDDIAQIWTFEKSGDYYIIRLKSKPTLVLASVGTANGSGAGNASTSAGNVVVQTYVSGNANQLWSFRETNEVCYWYEGGGLVTGNVVNADADYYFSKMGYKHSGPKNSDSSTFLGNLSNSDIFVYDGHGEPGTLLGNGSQSTIASLSLLSSKYSLSSLADGSLNNVKLAVYYACYSGTPSSTPLAPSIVAATYQKGAKCVIGWNSPVSVYAKAAWNTEFLNSLYNKSTIIAAITKANTEIKKISTLGQLGVDYLVNDRVTQGDTNQKLY
ncbi:MAG: RICIN domain-containing protein [Oscillospiraceae bacterium]|nr:RICIN domain-containing protein [Oscillospiraceae bacterium]